MVGSVLGVCYLHPAVADMFVARDRVLKPGQQLGYTTAALSDQKSQDRPPTTGEALFDVGRLKSQRHCRARIALFISATPSRPVLISYLNGAKSARSPGSESGHGVRDCIERTD